MLDLPGGFEVQGIFCYPHPDDAGRWYYVPGTPLPEEDPNDRPTLILWVMGQGAILQLGAQWIVEPALLSDLRREALSRLPDPPPASLELDPAPLSVSAVVLAVGDGSGQFSELQSSSSAGFPPYTALFHIQLSAEQKAHAIASLNGNPGYLTVTYRGSLSASLLAWTTIQGEVQADLDALDLDPTLEDCQEQIDAALQVGRLQITRSATPGVSAETWAEVDGLAHQKAAALLQEMKRGAPSTVGRAVGAPSAPAGSQAAGGSNATATTQASAFLQATASLLQWVELPLERTADLSAWFPGGNGADHIRMAGISLPGEVPPAPSGPAEARLGFDPGDAPLAFVQLTLGSAQALLRGPNFQPVSLPAGAGEGRIRTSYTTGGPAYEAVLPAPGLKGWELGPADLGLARVSVDASARAAAGAQEIRLHVLYQPSGQGIEDDRILRLKDGQWAAEWYVVTRSAGLQGEIEYDWDETTADGSLVRHAAATVQSPEIKLT